MYKDYEYWYKENKELIEHLAHHNSLIYDRYRDIFDVLNYISTLDDSEVDNDLEVIFDEGYAYIYDRISYIKLYLNEKFIGDLHAFLKYEVLINYYLFLEDIADIYNREEMDISPIKEGLDNLSKKITYLIDNRKPYGEEEIEEFDIIISSLIPSNKEIITVPEIFNRINEEIIIKKGQEGIE